MAYPKNPIYKLEKDIFTGKDCSVSKMNGNIKINIPFVVGNKDYDEYLEWVAEGNTPEEAD